MSATGRAAISLLTLIGFYVFALLLIAALVLGGVWAASQGAETVALKIIGFSVIVAIGILIALWRVATFKPTPEPGVALSREDAPELWAMVDDLAEQVGTRTPEHLTLVPEVNAAVSEDARLLGLVSGTRRLYLGVPLLQGLTVAQLRAVVGHELGHYSSAHTRLGPIAYRGRQAVVVTVQQLRGNIIGWLLRQYAKVYILVSQAMSRGQELEADRVMVQVAGRSTAQSALRELPVLDQAWAVYMNGYVALGWESGLAPTADEFFDGFQKLLAGRSADLAELRAEPPVEAHSAWDSHPPVAARVAAMENLADPGTAVVDGRPATALIPGFAAAAAATAEAVVAFGTRERLTWPELVNRAMTLGGQRSADVVYRGVARLIDQPTAALSAVVDLAEAGRVTDVTRTVIFGASDEEVAAETPDVLEALVSAAVLQSGAASWRLSWDGPAELVSPSGTVVDTAEVAALLTDPATVGAARARLAELGIRLEAAGLVSETATAHGGDVIGGIADVKVDGTRQDLLVLDNGFILVPSAKKPEGKDRLIALVESGSVVELAERHRFVAYESVATAQLDGRVTVKATLTLHDGTVMTLKEPLTADRLTSDSAELLTAHLQAYTGQPA
ncbi:M48 family metallopeptidase [Antribacter gilvus]|uniref:M48 family metallopeptidase n=1 Tax=Antribacter gilvus TaxID=2304675 RepID=UPI000F778884|nr:M48 family metallopeptidase [Antribacter gilvus]